MADFWASATPILNLLTIALMAWIGKSMVALQTELAVIKTRLSHLEKEHRGKG